MISFKLYVNLLLIVVGIVFIPTILLDFYHEPLTGDLTRIGMFSENEFGWNKKTFRLTEEPEIKGSFKEHYDVVILGDSFSDKPSSWSKILAQSTSLSVGLFNINNYSDVFEFLNILKNKNMPRVFIFESVERALKVRLGKFNHCPTPFLSYINNFPPVEYSLNNNVFTPYLRNRDLGVDDLAYSLKYMSANLVKTHGKVLDFNLSDSTLFSNSSANRVLVFSDDFHKISWNKKDWGKITCNALHIQSQLNESGSTKFIFLVAPDKSTIYEKFILEKYISGSQLDILASNNDLNFVRVDDFLIQKVEQGEKDIYWPNDTHWSFRGHELVATKILGYLTEKKIITKIN